MHPFMDDLPTTEKDCKVLLSAWKKYGINDTGPNNMYNMIGILTKKWFNDAIKHIMNELRSHPENNYLIHHAYAGHGMNINGSQIFLINEFDP